MEAIILAGGFGTRLKSVVSDLPKPMAPICNKPFLEYIFKYLKKNQINKVVLSVGYKWESIKEYFGDSFNDIKIVYSIENEPLGTGGAIKKALNLCENNNIFIINGDTFFDINLKLLELKNNSKIQIALKPMNNFDRYGSVKINSYNFIESFVEKTFINKGNINGGIYIISKNIFAQIATQNKFSFEEFLQNNFRLLNASAKIFNDYFIDIGIPEDYEKAQIELK